MKFLKYILFLTILSSSLPVFAWKAQRNKFNPVMIARYKSMLASRPDDRFAFRKLIHLYQSYSSLDKLILYYQKKLNKPSYSDLIILSRLYLKISQYKKLHPLLDKALKLKPNRYEAYKIKGQAFLRERDYKNSKKYLDLALTKIHNRAIKERLLKELIKISILGGDAKTGAAYFSRLLKMRPGNWSLRKDYADILVQAMLYKEAMKQYKKLIRSASGDTRRKVMIIKAQGMLYELMGKDREAIRSYWKAMRLTGSRHWIRRELINRIVAVSRRKDTLPLLVEKLKKKWSSPNGFQCFIIAKIYGEIGNFVDAFAYFRKAIHKEPSNIDYRLTYIDLLEKSGENPLKVVREYEALAASAPNQLRFSMELADRYFKIGRKAKALAIINRLIKKYPDDASLLIKAADLYAQWNKPQKVVSVYKTLIKLEPMDYEHYINLGQQYWNRGNRKSAIATWRKLIEKPGLFRKKSEAYYTFAKILFNIKKFSSALFKIRTAIKKDPENPEYHLLLAEIRIKLQRPRRAEKSMLTALKYATKQNNMSLMKKTMNKLIDLWFNMKVLKSRLKRLYARWDKTNIDQGIFIARGYIKLGKWKQPEQIYIILHKKYPSMSLPLLGLINLYERIGKYEKLEKLLKKALKLIPGKKRELYERLSSVWTVLGDEKKARNYLRLAIRTGATDSVSWAKAAKLAAKLEDFESAVKAYKEAIRLDPFETKYYFDLAGLYIQMSKPRKAAKIYHQIIIHSSDDEKTERAADMAIELDDLNHSLGELERIVHPLSFIYTHRPIFNSILIKIYARYVPWLYEQKRNAKTSAERKKASETLEKISKRALKPLLEVLGDNKSNLKQVANHLLRTLENPNSAYPLIRMAKRKWSKYLKKKYTKSSGRTRYSHITKMLQYVRFTVYTVAKLKNPAVSKELEFFAKQTEDPQTAFIALWGLAKIKYNHPLILKYLQKPETQKQNILACSVLAPHKRYRNRVLSIVKNKKTNLNIRKQCFKYWVFYSSERDFPVFKKLKNGFIRSEMKKLWDILTFYMPQMYSLQETVERYWTHDGFYKKLAAQSLLWKLKIRNKKEIQINKFPSLYKTSEQIPLMPFFVVSVNGVNRLNKTLTPVYMQNNMRAVLLMKRLINLRTIRWRRYLDRSAIKFDILTAYPVMESKKCTSRKELVKVLKSFFDSQHDLPYKLRQNILASWDNKLSLIDFDDFCNEDYGLKTGKEIILSSFEKIQNITNSYNTAYSIKRKIAYYRILKDHNRLFNLFSSSTSSILRRDVLIDLKTNSFILPYETYAKLNKLHMSKNERIILTRLAVTKTDRRTFLKIISHLDTKDSVLASMKFNLINNRNDAKASDYMDFLRNNVNVYLIKKTIKILKRRFPGQYKNILKALPQNRLVIIKQIENSLKLSKQ